MPAAEPNASGTNILVALEDTTLIMSKDNGSTWRQIDPPQPGYRVLDLEISRQGVISLLRRPSDELIRAAAYDLWANKAANDERDAQAFWTSAEAQLAEAAPNGSFREAC